MTITLWLALYAMLAFVLCAIVLGVMWGEADRFRDEHEAWLAERRRLHFKRIADLEAFDAEAADQRRRNSALRLNRMVAAKAHIERVNDAARTWSA